MVGFGEQSAYNKAGAKIEFVLAPPVNGGAFYFSTSSGKFFDLVENTGYELVSAPDNALGIFTGKVQMLFIDTKEQFLR